LEQVSSKKSFSNSNTNTNDFSILNKKIDFLTQKVLEQQQMINSFICLFQPNNNEKTNNFQDLIESFNNINNNINQQQQQQVDSPAQFPMDSPIETPTFEQGFEQGFDSFFAKKKKKKSCKFVTLK